MQRESVKSENRQLFNYLFGRRREKMRLLLRLAVLLWVAGSSGAGETPLDADIGKLVEQLKLPEQEVRGEAITKLVEVGRPAVKPLISCLRKGEEIGGSPAAACALGRIGDTSAVPALIDALQSPGSVGWEAARALGEIGDHRAIEPLLKSMDIWGSTAVFVALGKLKDSRAVEPLVKKLTDKNYAVREAAATALGMLADKRATDALIGLLSDEDPVVRAAVVKALGQIGDVRAVGSLVAILEDATPGIRGAAIRSLGTIRDSRAVAPLIKLLDDDSEGWLAAEALGAIGDPKAVNPLVLYLERVTAKARRNTKEGGGMLYSASKALAALDNARAIAVLQEMSLDEDEPLRREIQMVLEELRRTHKAKGAEPRAAGDAAKPPRP
jgi:HEAT repeat protein